MKIKPIGKRNKIKIINDSPFAYEILGRSYCSLREHKKGLDFFEKSIELKFDIKVCIGYLFFSSYFKDLNYKNPRPLTLCVITPSHTPSIHCDKGFSAAI